MKTTETINYQAIKGMRSGEPVTGAQDIQEAALALKAFIEAQRGDNEELRKWKRDKFDNQFAKYIHKYFMAKGASGKPHQLEEAAYKDLHFMTTKYLELVGSVEFNSYM
jgi:hypothetical protein